MTCFERAPANKKRLTLIAVFVMLFASVLQSGTDSVILALAAAEIGGTEYYALAKSFSSVSAAVLMPIFFACLFISYLIKNSVKYFFFWNNIRMLPYNCFYIFTWFFTIINDKKHFSQETINVLIGQVGAINIFFCGTFFM